jgi:ABC-2 type transport system permease protein
MIKLIYAELFKIASKPRSYLGLLAITVIVGLIHLAMLSDGKNYLDFIFSTFSQTFDISGKILNGNLIAFIILQMLVVQMPLLVAFVTGDIISGESAGGTLRLLAGRPFSRTQIFFAKYIASAVYTAVLILWLGILSLVVGRLLFGDGDMMVLKSDGLTVIRAHDILWRYGIAFLIAFLSLMLIASYSFCISAFADNSITPLVICMATIIIFTIIGTLEIPFFDYVKPFLFTTHMIVWRNIFYQPIDWSEITVSMAIMMAYIVGFTGVAWYHFKTKDILS